MKRLKLTRSSYIVISGVLVFLVAVLITAASLVRERRVAAIEESEAQVVRFVSGAEAAVNRSLLGVDVLLASMDNLLGLASSMPEWIDPEAASRAIQVAMRQNLLVSSVALINPQGQTTASSSGIGKGLELQLPPEYIASVLAQPVSTLVISAPMVSFRSSEVVLFLGRHIKLADGSKLLAVAEIAVPQLTSVLVQGVDIRGLEATIERGNGDLLAAAPLSRPLAGTRLSPELASQPVWDHPRDMSARLSGVPAIVVVRNTLYGGVFITASVPLHAALEDWTRESGWIALVAGVFALMILAAGVFAIWHLDMLAKDKAAIAQGKNTLDQALEAMVSGFVLLDAQQRVLSWNRHYIELYPWLKNRIHEGVPFVDMVAATADKLMQHESEAQRQDWVRHRMGLLSGPFESRQVTSTNGLILEINERPTPDGGTVIVYQDVSRLHQAMADAEQLAFFDTLTKLPNRRLLNDRLQQAIHASQRNGKHGALLFLDLDHFKTLNDTAGHIVGDMLLQQVAQRLKSCVREEDTVARLGGDEFVVMLQSLSVDPVDAAAQAQVVGDSILATLTQPYQLLDTQHTSTVSIGATLFGQTEQDSNELLQQADIAMYQVKNAGRNALCFFDPQMLAAITARVDLERDLRQALEAQQFVLHYQVQVGHNAHPVGAEALIRWQHPVRGMVPPGQFITLAEETGLILPMGEWVLRTACRQLKSWEDQPGTADLQLAVNVSARQFRAADFVNVVRAVVAETAIKPHLLKLELTESLVLDNITDTIQKMQALKTSGVRFSMDDFGTGYSSLAYLTQLPLDQLKIDQSFVRNIGQQASDIAVIDTIIGLAKSLELEVIAEGVETTEQRDFLAAHGCHVCQGYLFGKPQPAQDFETWLIANRIAA